MIDYIALTGPAGSGKTTLAKALERTHRWINFTDFLKQLAVEALKPLHVVSVSEMHQNKPKYRGFLQEFGELVDFTGNSVYIEAVLGEWSKDPFPCCFDNVRSMQQAEYLRKLGFTVVKLQATDEVLRTRGQVITASQKQHSIEQGLPDALVDVFLDAGKPITELVLLIERGSYDKEHSRTNDIGLVEADLSSSKTAVVSSVETSNYIL